MKQSPERSPILFFSLAIFSLLQSISFYTISFSDENEYHELKIEPPNPSFRMLGRNASSNDLTVEQELLDTASACLLVMDDNHYITEWLAYHYHSLPLRHVVIAVDPRSQTSPSKLVDRWRGRMTIELWNDTHFTPQNFTTRYARNPNVRQMHLERQKKFNLGCLRHLKKLNKGWVLMADTDEYTRINPHVLNPDKAIHDPNRNVPPVNETGSVLKFLNQLIVPDPKFDTVKTPCVPIFRQPFGVTESPDEKVNSDVPEGFDASSFQTLRWRYWKKRSYKLESKVWNKTCPVNLVLPGKTMIDLTRLKLQDLYHPKNDGNPHWPLTSICPAPWPAEDKAPLIIHHYMGTLDQFMYRSDNRGVGFRTARHAFLNSTVGVEENDDLRPWLNAFVDSVGPTEAKRLLEGVGELEPIVSDEEQDEEQQQPENSTPELLYQIGDKVQVNLHGRGHNWVWAEVYKVHPDGFYDVMFKGCKREIGLPAIKLRTNGTNVVDWV